MIKVYSDGVNNYISLRDLGNYLECGQEQFYWLRKYEEKNGYIETSKYIDAVSDKIINNKASKSRMYSWRRLRIEALIKYLKTYTRNNELVCINEIDCL